MLPTVTTIKPGYFRWVRKYTICNASCTISLVREGKIKMMVDTGNECDKNKIIKGLAKHKLTPGQITHVVNTHYHPDHTGCNYLFNKAEIITSGESHKKDRYKLYEGDFDVTRHIKIAHTPGHTEDDCSVLVKTEQGIVAIVGDLFWRGQDDKPAFIDDKRQLHKSRNHILDISDYVVPGHDKQFKVM